MSISRILGSVLLLFAVLSFLPLPQNLSHGIGFFWQLFAMYLACVLIWTLLKGSRPKHAKKWMESLEMLVAKNKRNKMSGNAKLSRIMETSLVFLCTTFFVYAATRPPKWPIETQHNVKIWRQESDRQWWMTSDENPEGFMYYACADMGTVIWPSDNKEHDGNTAWIKAGYYAVTARWEVKGDCNSIRNTGLKFSYDWLPVRPGEERQARKIDQ